MHCSFHCSQIVCHVVGPWKLLWICCRHHYQRIQLPPHSPLPHPKEHTHRRVCIQLFDWNLAEMFTPSYLWSVFGDFPDKRGNILLDIFIWVFEAGEDCREDLSLHHHLSQVNRMLGDLTQGWEHLALHTQTQRSQAVPVCIHTTGCTGIPSRQDNLGLNKIANIFTRRPVPLHFLPPPPPPPPPVTPLPLPLAWVQLTLSLASGLRIIWARWAMAPASTTVWASSGECLQMSLRAEAAIRFSESSGSWMHSTSRGTAPASTTAWASSV